MKIRIIDTRTGKEINHLELQPYPLLERMKFILYIFLNRDFNMEGDITIKD